MTTISAPAAPHRRARQRRVWDYLTRNPRASLGDMCRDLELAKSTVQGDLRQLEELGYIKRTPKSVRARVVLVPFMDEAQGQRKKAA